MSLNMVIKGLALENRLTKGDVVIVSSREHNAMMRPLTQLKNALGIKIVVCNVGENFEEDLAALVEQHRPKLVALVWASNVTGEVLPIEAVAKYLKARDIPLLVDGAQAAGKLKLDLNECSGISYFSTSGHKGLMGAPGVGLLYVAPQHKLAPFIAGGTGSGSESLAMPTAFPDRLEPGTLPGPAIAALSAGVDWLKKNDSEGIMRQELALTEEFLSWTAGMKTKGLRIYGPGAGVKSRMPTVSFSIDKLASASVADRLDTEYGIAVRSGLHCSAVTHESLGTLESGLVRVSFGPFNKPEEMHSLCRALEEIAEQA